MNWKIWERKPSVLDEPRDKVLLEMKQYGSDTPEFEKQLAYLERLQELKAQERKSGKVSKDTVWVVVGNVVGILAIVAYEQKHVFSSKGLGFIRPKSP